MQEEDGGCVVGFLIARLGAVAGGGGRVVGAVGGEMGEEDAVGVDVERYEQCFWYSEGGRDGVVEDLGTVRGGEDVDFEGGGGGGVEDEEEVGVGCGGGGAGRGKGCHGERLEGGGTKSGYGGVGWGESFCLADFTAWFLHSSF